MFLLTPRVRLVSSLTLAGMCALVSTSGCSSSSAATGPSGSAVAGALDTHCGSAVVTVDSATCHGAPAADVDAGDAPPEVDAGDPPDDGSSDYGATMFNAEGDDDDCKYHVQWGVSGARNGGDATFTVTLTAKSGGAPVTGASPRIEAFLNDTHPAPNTDQKAIETSSGKYTVGPIKLDASGNWTVRFHFFEDCNDGDQSPHGHAAFFLSVP